MYRAVICNVIRFFFSPALLTWPSIKSFVEFVVLNHIPMEGKNGKSNPVLLEQRWDIPVPGCTGPT